MLWKLPLPNGKCERSHAQRASRVASAYPRDVPQVLYSAFQKNDLARRHEHYWHVYFVRGPIFSCARTASTLEEFLWSFSFLSVDRYFFGLWTVITKVYITVDVYWLLCLLCSIGLQWALYQEHKHAMSECPYPCTQGCCICG